MERRLAAILAADVVGYSRLIGEDEERTLTTLKTYRGVVDGLIARREGRVFGSAGDSLVAEFASPVEAVRCATEIQLETGNTVERHLKNNDVVLLGRQPSLKPQSLESRKVIIKRDGSMTLSVNPTEADCFHFDFDGDEMVIYVSQNDLADVEAEEMMSIYIHLVNEQDSTNSVKVMQGLFSLLNFYN